MPQWWLARPDSSAIHYIVILCAIDLAWALLNVHGMFAAWMCVQDTSSTG